MVFAFIRFAMFASLFDETTGESFTATQALNPGFFFKEAADYAKKRKMSANNVCQVLQLSNNYLFSKLTVIISNMFLKFILS